MIDQLTVFLGNKQGRLSALCQTLGNSEIQMHALTVADTSDYGIVRIICDKPVKAADALKANGFTASLAKIVAVKVPNVPGGAAKVFEAVEGLGASIEYAYCFTPSVADATLAIKVDAPAEALEAAGLELLHPADLYSE